MKPTRTARHASRWRRSAFLPGHEPGIVERPSFGSENRHAGCRGHRAAAISTMTLASPRNSRPTSPGRIGSNRDVLLFVHGFNNGYDEARFRLAQIVYDGQLRRRAGAVHLGIARTRFLAYGSDRETAAASRDALETAHADAWPPNAGGRQACIFLRIPWGRGSPWKRFARTRSPVIADLDGHLGEVMLASPDIDLALFRQQVARSGRSRPTYLGFRRPQRPRACHLSSALGQRPASVWERSTRRRPMDKAAIEQLGVKVYDTSAESVGLIGHANYADAPDVDPRASGPTTRSHGAQGRPVQRSP